MFLLNTELSLKELVLLKSALLSYRDCPNCSKEYPRTHNTVVRYILPKIKKIARQKFEELTNFV
jgi:hypothetical protein